MKRRAAAPALPAGSEKHARTARTVGTDEAKASDPLAWRRCAEWIVANGGAVSSLAIGTSVTGLRGLHATRPIPQGMTVLRIPRRCVVTTAKVFTSQLGTALSRLQEELVSETLQHAPADLLLALFLVLDRANEGSFFAPYHATLPDASSVGALPLNWQAGALEMLRGSRLFAAVEQQRRAILEDHALITRCWGQCFSDPDIPAPDLEAFKWGLTMVSSRAFELDWPDEEKKCDEDEATAAGSKRAPKLDLMRTASQERVSKPRLGETAVGTTGMVPLFDLGNHKRPRDVSYTSNGSDVAGVPKTSQCDVDHDGEVVVTTLRDIDADEEVCMTYGAQPNAKLLQDYGFVTLPNIEPDGSSNDTLKLILHRAEPADDSVRAVDAEVEVELRMAVGTSYTYFPFLKAIDVYVTDDSDCAVEVSQDASGADGSQFALQGAQAAGGGAGGPDDFEAFEAAMAAMDGDGDSGEEDAEEYDDDLADEAVDELYGGEGEYEVDSGSSTAATAAGQRSATAFAGGQDGGVAAGSGVAAALPKLISKLEALQAAYHSATCVDDAKAQLFKAHAQAQGQAQDKGGQHRNDSGAGPTAAAPSAGTAPEVLIAVAAAAIVLVEQCTLEFYIAAAKKAMLVLVHDDPHSAMAALEKRASQEQQQEQRQEKDGRQPHHRSAMEQQVHRLCCLCRGVGSTRLALALLQLRCGLTV